MTSPTEGLRLGAVRYTGLTLSDVIRIVQTGPSRYKTYPIKKRSGGERIIAQPARELKDLQYFLMDVLLAKFPIHAAATAYRKGLSIRDNAQVHAASKAILKMDFTDFFGSIKDSDFDLLCRDNSVILSDVDLDFCHKVLFWRPPHQPRRKPLKLSIGAPSSPLLSNAVMYNFDNEITKLCQRQGVVYSRYADDLTFSANNVDALRELRDYVPRFLRKLEYPLLYVNWNKTVLAAKGNRRAVTGLILADDGKVSLGRNKKRTLRAAVHALILGRLDEEEAEELRGRLAFAMSAEPEFLDRLRQKYGEQNINNLMSRAFRRKRGDRS